jgi:ubiquinone/menaquinone biosynthesis C-methylase UbiE
MHTSPLPAVWDELAPKWDALLADADSFVNREEAFRRFHWFLKRTLKIGNRTKTYRLLDLACGTGEASWPLWKRVASVTFFDHSPVMLRLARNKYPKGVFVRGDAASPPFLDAEFEVIVSRGALISQLDPAQITAYLTGVWRILRPQGLFLFDFVCNPASWNGGGMYASSWNRREMEALLRRCLPTAAIQAWDGTEAHAMNRVVIRKV